MSVLFLPLVTHHQLLVQTLMAAINVSVEMDLNPQLQPQVALVSQFGALGSVKFYICHNCTVGVCVGGVCVGGGGGGVWGGKSY